MRFTLLKRIYKKFTTQRWNVGFIEETIDEIVDGKSFKIRIVNHNYKDRWFADPFILDCNEEFIYLLVEELYYKWGRGRISKLTIDRKKNSIISIEPIIQLESHLSFPAILRKGGMVYLYPENANGYGLALYKYNPSNAVCEMERVITKKPLADAILTDVLGKEELYATEIPTHNGNTLNQYRINEDGDISLKNQYRFSSNIARNAGDWFVLNGKAYRPAQDCNNCYGGAVIIQELILKDNQLVFRDIRHISSTSWRYATGCHTFNHYKGITVVDLHGYRYPIIGRLFKMFFPKFLLK